MILSAAGALALLCSVCHGASTTIAVPSTCHTVTRVDATRIYLASPRETCARGATRIPVDVPPGTSAVDVYIDEVFWQRQETQSLTRSEIDTVLQRAENLARDLEPPAPNVPNTQAKQHAETAVEGFQSPEYQARLQAERSRLAALLAPASGGEARSDASSEDDHKAILPADERLYLFVSSSIPIDTLRTYVRALAKLRDPNISMVLRGFVGGAARFQPTLDFLTQLLLVDDTCTTAPDQCERYEVPIVIDPLLFRRYSITEVPTVVYAKSVRLDPDARGSEGLPENASVGTHHGVSGDLSFDAALEQINRAAQSLSLERALAALRQGFYP